MKALVLERRGSKAILLLPGGEMRVVRTQKDWQIGMEVAVKPYPRPKKKKGSALRAVFYPAAAFAAALVMTIGGLRLLGGGHIDRQQPVQPLASGSASAAPTDALTASLPPEPTDAPTPHPTPEPTDALTASPTPASTPTDAPTASVTPTQLSVQPTPQSQEQCDECGKYGHDDDDCPDQICDECGKYGHDDDDCPNQICDECGQRGHDDDDCPNGGRGHHDD